MYVVYVPADLVGALCRVSAPSDGQEGPRGDLVHEGGEALRGLEKIEMGRKKGADPGSICAIFLSARRDF